MKVILLVIVFFCSLSIAESNSYTYIAQGGQVKQVSGGAIILPVYVYQSLDQGKLNPFLQLQLQQQVMAGCVNKQLEKTPSKTTPFVTAKGAFDQAVCEITKCFQQMMILDYLAQSSNNPSANGGITDPQQQAGNQQIAQILLSTVEKSPCGQGQSVDPNLQKVAAQ